MTNNINYWGFRLGNVAKLYGEMKEGRLRQGWGWDPGQDLRKLINNDKDAVNEGASRNRSMYDKVKKGDIILVTIPHKVEWNKIAIVEATLNWDDGYDFDPIDFTEKTQDYQSDDNESNPVDYGHVFPVKYLREFHTHNPCVHGEIRKTFRCYSRFWSINRYAPYIEVILKENPDNLNKPLYGEEKLDNAINKEFNKLFNEEHLDKLLDNVQESYNAAEWEQGIKIGLEKLVQTSSDIRVDTTANKTEKEHGADLLIYFPNPIDESIQYVIAVQVKDHKGVVSTNAVKQIIKADKYFKGKKEEGLRLIEMMVVITNAEKIDNKKIEEEAAENNVKILFKRDFELLLTKIANSYITLKPQED